MALQVQFDIFPVRYPDPDEVAVPVASYPQAYARIAFVRSMAQDSYITVCWYANEAARAAGEDPVFIKEFVAATQALTGDIYPAAYNYLKTLPEFAGAIDC